ncbi:TPA: glucosaminidase domain-containing protein [Staphylococcus aureus]|nr:glucosaminidase domain-containing protein [Staphylococcus aureus]HDJ6675722.1 glucosaminidase domain-containing protein [Staphylococcus aureus]
MRCIKLMCGSALVASTCFTTYETTSTHHEAKASNLPVIDTQHGCTVGGDEDSKTGKDDVSPKDQNINMKKYKKTFEKNAKGGKLEGMSMKILDIAEEEKVPPLLMIAIIVNESGWGTGANAMKQNNPLSVMGNKSIGESTYDTIEEGLHAGAKNLYEGYIKEGLDTPKKIGPKYAPVGAANDPDNLNANWVPNNEQVMKDLGAEDIGSSSSDDKDDEKDDEKEEEGASSADTSNDSVPKSACGEQDKSSEDSSGGKTSGELGASVKANGKSGKKIEGNWTYDEIPEKYKKHIELPKFQPKYLKGSPFVQSGDNGQCTEFTWAMMNQLYEKDQPAFDGITNGDSVYQIYEKRGAKTTHNPTVGYGFSSSPPYALAAIPGVGHTGVVAGVMDDGKFIIAQMNVDPDPAPSRTVLYSVIDGVPKDAGNDLIFFEGVGELKKEYKKKK